MDEELRAEEHEHEPVPADAADQVTLLAATAVRPGRMPAIYLGHGAPPLVDDPLWVVQLEAWAAALPRPRAILMVSAHWESAPLTIGATDDGVPLVYDFGGFAERYLAMLAAGGTKHYSELLKPFGLDAKDPQFWNGGLSVISGMIDELETMG